MDEEGHGTARWGCVRGLPCPIDFAVSQAWLVSYGTSAARTNNGRDRWAVRRERRKSDTPCASKETILARLGEFDALPDDVQQDRRRAAGVDLCHHAQVMRDGQHSCPSPPEIVTSSAVVLSSAINSAG